MEEGKKALPQAGPELCAQNPENSGESMKNGRIWLLLTLAACVLLTDAVLSGVPGLGLAASVWAWYGLSARFALPERRRSRESRLLLLANLLLGASFAVNSNAYFRIWNLLALLVLLPIQLGALGGARIPWWRPAMLTERLGLFFRGALGNLPAAPRVLTGMGKGPARRAWTAAAGICAAAALVLALLPVLSSADALFASLTDAFLAFCRAHLTAGLVRFLIGLCLTPFAFGLLEFLRRHPETEQKVRRRPAADSLLFVLVLAALAALYLLFLAVQAAGIAGGAAFLARRGISYAAWARSGFFQMVGVTAVNLAVLLSALAFGKREGRGWRAVKGLAALLTAESALLLVSAAWRMSLYVGVYGLSFKRVMTYWGMGMMAIFLWAALLALYKKEFSFCRAAGATALAGWLAINCLPVDTLVAKDSVDRCLSGESAAVDLNYLTFSGLSYDTLRQLERLDGTRSVLAYDPDFWGQATSLDRMLAQRREDARQECARWESWNLSAWLAARGA